MVTPNFPPQLNPESICNGKLAQALVDSGVELTVVTQSFNPAKHIKDESPCWNGNMGKVMRLSPPWYSITERTGNLPAKIRMRERSTSWFSSAAYGYCRRLLRGQSFDIILSRSNPVDAMIVGYCLRKDFNIKWVAGLNDPHPTCFYPEPYGKGYPDSFFEHSQTRWTRKALSIADHVLFPCERLGRYMIKALNLKAEGRMIVAPHIGWRRDALKSKDDYINILHIGTLGPPRVSKNFLRCFYDLLLEHSGTIDNIRLIFLGRTDEKLRRFIKENGMESHIIIENQVSYEESLKRIDEASVILLMEATLKEGIFFPSKFCDYAISNKPLLLFSPEKGTISDLVGGYSHPGFLGQEEKRFKYGIDRLLRRLDKNESLSDYTCPRPDEFEAKHVVNDLLAGIS